MFGWLFNRKKDDEFRQIMVYFKGVYGVEIGSIEYAVDVDKLIKDFESIGYKAIFNKSFDEIDEPHLRKMRNNFKEAQLEISKMQHMIILKKVGNSGGHYGEYQKYKKKYLKMK